MLFTARVISGAGRGKGLGVPTLNLDLQDVPRDLEDGVFACRAWIEGKEYPATMHHGPRPTFNDSRSCEVHLINAELPSPPRSVDLEVVQALRGISRFPSADALSKQMRKDSEDALRILSGDGQKS